MKTEEIKGAIGRRCTMKEPRARSWTMPLVGEYMITGYGFEVEYYGGEPRRTVRVQCESTGGSPVRVWVPPEIVELIEEWEV